MGSNGSRDSGEISGNVNSLDLGTVDRRHYTDYSKRKLNVTRSVSNISFNSVSQWHRTVNDIVTIAKHKVLSL